MRINIRIIDNKGFIHFEIGKSKKLVLDFINKLKENTEVRWLSKDNLFISQQYTK